MQLTASAKGKLYLEYYVRNPKKAECLFCHNNVMLYLAKWNQWHDRIYYIAVVEDRAEADEKVVRLKNLPWPLLL